MISKFGKTLPFSGNSGWENKLRVSLNFLGVYLFAFVEYLCNHSLKMRIKNFENYISILTIVNYRMLHPLQVFQTMH